MFLAVAICMIAEIKYLSYYLLYDSSMFLGRLVMKYSLSYGKDFRTGAMCSFYGSSVGERGLVAAVSVLSVSPV